MLYRKQGMPEEGELVLCTVTKIQYNSVFAALEEYDKKGMIHISEIAPGRIRNIHDYVREGKIVVCVVLRVDMERGHIDLSLRRVNESQKRNKLNQIKQEQKAEKIVEFAAKELKTDINQLYALITEKVFEKYSTLYSCFEDIVAKNITLEEIGIKKDIADVLTELILQRIKLPKVEIKGKLFISTYEENGIGIIKDIFKKVQDIGKEQLTINYLGGGTYSLGITAENYKDAEKLLEKILYSLKKDIEKSQGTFKFERSEK